MLHKAKTVKGTADKFDFNKLKFYVHLYTIKKVKQNEIFATHVTGKGILSKICKRIL